MLRWVKDFFDHKQNGFVPIDETTDEKNTIEGMDNNVNEKSSECDVLITCVNGIERKQLFRVFKENGMDPEIAHIPNADLTYHRMGDFMYSNRDGKYRPNIHINRYCYGLS
jgi:hypothetical protein